MESYFQHFGGKPCCYEDLRPYADVEGLDTAKWTATLEAQDMTFVSLSCSGYSIVLTNGYLKPSVPELWRYINAQKLLRYGLSASHLTPEAEIQRSVRYLDAYLDGLTLGKDLPSYELQPADDLAIMAAQAMVNAWKLSGDDAPLYNAAALLEYAVKHSKMSYQIHLHLIQIYRLLGAPSLAVEHYRGIKVKQVQNDTLSHFLLSRASTFSLSSVGDLTFTTECLESSRIYLSNSEEVRSLQRIAYLSLTPVQTTEFTVRCFSSEKYSQVRVAYGAVSYIQLNF